MRVFVRALALLAVAGLGLAACATPQGPGSPDPIQPSRATTDGPPVSTLTPAGYDGRFAGMFTVLESPAHGPQLCSMVATSYPPQCGGPEIVGWDWTNVEKESFNGTTWGFYYVVGTWDEAARALTLTEPARNGDEVTDWGPGQRTGPDFTSPCPPPAGGWRPVDEAKATVDAMQAAMTIAEAEPDFAGAWIDQPYLTSYDSPDANNPMKFVLNVRFTGDLAGHEARLREVWGGALCVSPATRSMAELEQIQHELSASLGETDARSSAIDVVTGTVWVSLMVAKAEQQAELDQRYGEGVVILTGLLRPID
jgi:hypothetical protein